MASSAATRPKPGDVRFAVFSLVHDLDTEAQQDRLLATRSCVARALGPLVPFDHIIFHDGGVPLGRQQEVSALVDTGLTFVDAREYGGFTRVPRLLRPLDKAAIGYRHSE
jgi:hypothetical protein